MKLKIVNVMEEGLEYSSKIAVDWVGRKIYWASQGMYTTFHWANMKDKWWLKLLAWLASFLVESNLYIVFYVGSIEVSELDGSFRRTLITGGIEKPSSIVVDPSEG